jgi:hypothetical protein
MSQVSGEPPEEHEGLAAFAELKRTVEAAEDLESGFLELRKWLWKNMVAHDCLPQALPEDLKPIIERLTERLAQVRSAACEAFENLSARPAAKFLRGERLTRTEYYLLTAAGIFKEGGSKALGLSPYDDYDTFSFLHYEDEKRITYIDPSEKPFDPPREVSPGKFVQHVHPRLGIPPEEARLDALRPEQREFFKQHLPEIYKRFKS